MMRDIVLYEVAFCYFLYENYISTCIFDTILTYPTCQLFFNSKIIFLSLWVGLARVSFRGGRSIVTNVERMKKIRRGRT